MKSRRVLVIGGGIAGPAVGIALKRAGIDVVIHEASREARDNEGAFLNLAPNGLSVLRVLGVPHALDEGTGFQNDRLVFHNDGGRVLADVAVGGVTLMRGALSRALRQAAGRLGVPFEFGKHVESVHDDGGELRIRFSDGSESSGSCVIGADGIHSRTRSSVLPDGPRPTYTGIVNLGGVVRTDLPPTGVAMHMIFGRRAFFGYAVRPSGDTYWFSNYAQKTEPPDGRPLTVSADGIRPQLLDLHRDDPPVVSRILEAVTDNVGAFPVYDIPSLPTWHRGAVCLIGDAAHAVGPHVGQGTSLALEDAFVIAKCLRDLSDAPEAFTAFERIRRGRVEPVLVQSRRTAQQKAPAGWIARKIRDLVLPVFLRKGAAATAALYRINLDWDERIAVRHDNEADLS